MCACKQLEAVTVHVQAHQQVSDATQQLHHHNRDEAPFPPILTKQISPEFCFPKNLIEVLAVCRGHFQHAGMEKPVVQVVLRPQSANQRSGREGRPSGFDLQTPGRVREAASGTCSPSSSGDAAGKSNSFISLFKNKKGKKKVVIQQVATLVCRIMIDKLHTIPASRKI